MSTTNIVVGLAATGTLKAAAYGENETQAVDLGFIKGGINIEHEENSYEIKVDQVLGAIDKVTTDEALKIKFALAECTLQNIALALGYDAPAAGAAFDFGSKQNTPLKTLYANVKGPAGKTRKYTFWRCRPTGKTAQAYKRDGETLVEIEFDVLADITKDPSKRFGRIEDINE